MTLDETEIVTDVMASNETTVEPDEGAALPQDGLGDAGAVIESDPAANDIPDASDNDGGVSPDPAISPISPVEPSKAVNPFTDPLDPQERARIRDEREAASHPNVQPADDDPESDDVADTDPAATDPADANTGGEWKEGE